MTSKTANDTSPAARRRALTDYLLEAGTAHSQELADRYEVSLVTIHRDLDELERRGVIRKFHGGATALPSSVFESNVDYRRTLGWPDKQAISRVAAELVHPGMVVLLDDSTTNLALVELIADTQPLTVITNFQPIIARLITQSNIQLITLGGDYSASHDSFLGVPCIECCRALHADIGFYSCAGFANGQAYHQEHVVVVTKQAMLGVSNRRILLADHRKLGQSALHRVTDLEIFERMITDDQADQYELDDLRQRGLQVQITTVPNEVRPN